MDLGKHVVDKELLDRKGLRMGRVDDLVLEMGERLPDGSLPSPQVVSIVSGPMALEGITSRPTSWLARQMYRLLGLRNPRPIEIPWSDVTTIDVTVHVDVARDDSGAVALSKAVERRYIGRLPGA